MCALISSEDVLYFKADAASRADYEVLGAAQFHAMPYFELPAAVLEDEAQLAVWLSNAIKAAQRMGAHKRKKKI